MNYHDIQAALAALSANSAQLEDIYIENGGEITDETEAIEARSKALSDLLTTDGIDTLGRWLKAKEDELAAFKAEKALAERRIKSVQNTIDFIKGKSAEILRATGQEMVKGTYYGFTLRVSTKTSVDTDAIDADYLEAATEAARNAGLPPYVDVVLKATATGIKEYAAANEDEGIGYLVTEITDAVTFNKPKRAQEEKAE